MSSVALPSRIESVTVYRRGASVVRGAEIRRVDGRYPSKIKLTNLPLTLIDHSVRVRVVGDSAPIATDVQVALEVSPQDDALPPAEDEAVLAARRAVEELDDTCDRLHEETKLMQRLVSRPRPPLEDGRSPAASPTDARLALSQFRAARARAIAEALQQARNDLDAARRRLADLEHRRQRATTARQARPHELRKTAVISLQAHDCESATAQLLFEYQVPGARWAPAYAIHLQRDLGSLTLKTRAMVRQKTGEDWSDARLTLSTAAAQSWTELPELTSIRVGRRQAPPPPRWRPPPTGADALYADFDAAATRSEPRSGGTPRSDVPAMMDDVMGGEPSSTTDSLPVPSPVLRSAPPESEPTDLSVASFDDDTDVFQRTRHPPPPGAVAPPAPVPVRRSRARLPAPQAAMPPPSAALAGGPTQQNYGAPAPSSARPGAPPPPEPRRELDDRLLRFGDLRMPPPDARNRGRLVSADAETRYMSLLVEQNITVSFSVMTAISKVVTQANASEDAPPPKGHHFATTHDGFDHAHRALAPVDIPSDGEFHTIPVEASDGPSRRKFLAVPRETQDVFRVVEFDNPSQAPLLRGPADIYVGEDYLMTSNLDVTPSGGVVSLGLGVEQAIKISRNTSYREETAGLIRGSLVLHHEIDVSLTNHLDDDADVEVTERVPVARDGDDNVKVNLDSVEPSWSAYERKDRPAPGVYRWKVSVPAGGRQALSARYSIRVPAALELAGGNRREG